MTGYGGGFAYGNARVGEEAQFFMQADAGHDPGKRSVGANREQHSAIIHELYECEQLWPLCARRAVLVGRPIGGIAPAREPSPECLWRLGLSRIVGISRIIPPELGTERHQRRVDGDVMLDERGDHFLHGGGVE